MPAYIFQIQSGIVLALLFGGVYYAKNRKKHIRFMSAAVIWDIILILQIELNRDAIAKATEAMSEIGTKVMLNVHVSIAVTTVILYFVQIYLGRTSIKHNRNSLLDRHKLFGYLTVSMRILTFVTSFFVK